MSSGASKLGQQAPGQRSIFGGPGQRSIFGGNAMPGFAQMPSYTPVTRGQPEPQPEPPAQDYGSFGQEAAPSYQPASPAAPQAHTGVFYSGPAQNYQSPVAGTPQTPPTLPMPPAGHLGQQPAYPPQQAYSRQSHPGQAHPPQGPAQAYGGQRAPGQAYPSHPAPSPAYPGPGAPAHPGQGYPEAGFPGGGFTHADAGLTDADFPEASLAEANLQDPNLQDPNLQDASFPETIFPANLGHVEEEPVNLEMPAQDYAGQQGYEQQGYDQFGEETANFAPTGGATSEQAAYQGQAGQPSPQRALAPFDAVYDQPPQINLGPTEQPGPAPQGFYEGERPDVDFMDNDQIAPEVAAKAQGIASKFSLKSRSVFMVGSALLGAIALGGALAFAYKQSGGGMSSDTPIVQADARPVKQAPEQPGGKEFPHKNKLIYDRLENGDQPESEKLVPRQEELALPAMPGGTGIAGQPAAGASVDAPTAADGGPRRVKTLVVRPDGSVVPSAAGAAIAEGASPQQAVSAAGVPAAPAAETPATGPPAAPAQQTQAAAGPAPAAAQAQAPAAEPEQVAAIPAPAQPAPKPKPAPAAAKAPSSYVVQVGSRKDQTEALAAFADMQQKYPSLLGRYRPMVQKANLGSKGIWYRLRIGPIDDKKAASKLCGELKSQGHSDCLVMAN